MKKEFLAQNIPINSLPHLMFCPIISRFTLERLFLGINRKLQHIYNSTIPG